MHCVQKAVHYVREEAQLVVDIQQVLLPCSVQGVLTEGAVQREQEETGEGVRSVFGTAAQS